MVLKFASDAVKHGVKVLYWRKKHLCRCLSMCQHCFHLRTLPKHLDTSCIGKFLTLIKKRKTFYILVEISHVTKVFYLSLPFLNKVKFCCDPLFFELRFWHG